MFQDYVSSRVRICEEKADIGMCGTGDGSTKNFVIEMVPAEEMAQREGEIAEQAKQNGERAKERLAWEERAADLAAWAIRHLVVRPDAHGVYEHKRDGDIRQYKAEKPVTEATLVQHFQGKNLIGLYSTSKDDNCLWLTIDVDLHEDDPGLAKKNRAFVEHKYGEVEKLRRTHADSHDGKGSYHCEILFQQPIPAAEARSIGHWLIRDWESFGLAKEPEVFPKQDSIKGRYGNFVRLFGRHPKRPFYSRVFDGKAWLRGEEAIKFILAKEGDAVEIFPPEA